MGIEEAKERISSAELAEQIAYDRIELPVDEQIVFLLAQLCAMTFNAHRGNSRPMKPKDFLPKMEKPARDWREQRARFKQQAKIYNDGLNRKSSR